MTTWGPPAGPLELDLGGLILCVVPPPGPELVALAATGNWWGILPDLLDRAGQLEVYRRLDDDEDELDLPELHRAAAALAGHWLGQHWHVAVRLAATASQRWTLFDGWCLAHAFDPQDPAVPAHRIVSAVHAWIRDGVSEDKEWRKIEQQLYAPPPGADPEDPATAPWAVEEEGALFTQAMASLGGRG